MWAGHGRAPQTQGLGHPMAEPQLGQGTPCWVPDSPFRRYPSTFRGVWRVKRPLNPMKQGPLRPYRRELRNGSRITSIRLRCFEKSPENQRKRAQKSEPTTHGRPPSPPTGELGHVGWPWLSLADAGARPSHGRAPVKAGNPLLGPRQPVFSTSFDVWRCLEGQTTSESYETRTVGSVSKIASQRFKNHVHTTSVLREKPRKPRKHAQKSEPTMPGRPPSPPTGELGHVCQPWPSPADAEARPSHGRAPVKAGDPLLGPRQSVFPTSFDVSRCLEGQTTSESYETRTVVSVSKIASQRFENHLHTTSVLREKPRRPRKHAQKSEPTTPGRPPSPPTGELGHGGRPWPSPADAEARPSHGRAPVKA